MRILSVLIALFLSGVACAGEKVIEKFDGSTETFSSMRKIIRMEVNRGATIVSFPGGRWKWYDVGRLGLPPKENLVKKHYSVVGDAFEASVKDWIKLHDVKAVEIRIKPTLPADIFFRAEKCLSLLGIPYSVLNDPPMKGGVWLMETDGKFKPKPSIRDSVFVRDVSGPVRFQKGRINDKHIIKNPLLTE